jgi:hypothetical protein
VSNDNLAGVIISDQEYPNNVAHTLINKVLKVKTFLKLYQIKHGHQLPKSKFFSSND